MWKHDLPTFAGLALINIAIGAAFAKLDLSVTALAAVAGSALAADLPYRQVPPASRNHRGCTTSAASVNRPHR